MRHVYMIASVQKGVTTVAVMKLSESGKLDLDDDVGNCLPFELQNPEFPNVPITVRMLLAHRSGLGEARYQFGWDTRAIFSPEYRPYPPQDILTMTLEELMTASLVPGGENYNDDIWRSGPGTSYYYSTTVFPLLRFIVERVTEQSYGSYVQEHIFTPLGMGSSGFLLEEFPGRHASPYTRIDGRNILLPRWEGQGCLLRCTAEDLSYFFLALQNTGRHNGVQLLSAESVRLMTRVLSSFAMSTRFSAEAKIMPRREKTFTKCRRPFWRFSIPGIPCARASRSSSSSWPGQAFFLCCSCAAGGVHEGTLFEWSVAPRIYSNVAGG